MSLQKSRIASATELPQAGFWSTNKKTHNFNFSQIDILPKFMMAAFWYPPFFCQTISSLSSHGAKYSTSSGTPAWISQILLFNLLADKPQMGPEGSFEHLPQGILWPLEWLI